MKMTHKLKIRRVLFFDKKLLVQQSFENRFWKTREDAKDCLEGRVHTFSTLALGTRESPQWPGYADAILRIPGGTYTLKTLAQDVGVALGTYRSVRLNITRYPL